jgi:hypothetical protein
VAQVTPRLRSCWNGRGVGRRRWLSAYGGRFHRKLPRFKLPPRLLPPGSIVPDPYTSRGRPSWRSRNRWHRPVAFPPKARSLYPSQFVAPEAGRLSPTRMADVETRLRWPLDLKDKA